MAAEVEIRAVVNALPAPASRREIRTRYRTPLSRSARARHGRAGESAASLCGCRYPDAIEYGVAFHFSNQSVSVPGFDEKLHFHLFELASPENKIAWRDFVSEGFADLSDSERDLLARGLLHVQEVDVNSLSGFRAQINDRCRVFERPHMGFEHQIELAGLGERAFGTFARLLAGLFQAMSEVQLVGAEAAFAFFAVHQRIDESRDVAGGLPDFRMHENRGIDSFNVLAVGHGAPPGILHVALELDPERTVIPAGIDAAVDLHWTEKRTPGVCRGKRDRPCLSDFERGLLGLQQQESFRIHSSYCGDNIDQKSLQSPSVLSAASFGCDAARLSRRLPDF